MENKGREPFQGKVQAERRHLQPTGGAEQGQEGQYQQQARVGQVYRRVPAAKSGSRWSELTKTIAFTIGAVLLAGALWFLSKPQAYQSSEGQHVDAADRYQYQPDPGCTPYELAQVPIGFERAAQARGCANQAQDYHREIDDLTQQTRAAEGVEKANWLGESNYLLSRLQLILSALGAVALIYSLHLNRRATASAQASVHEARNSVRTAEAAVTLTREMTQRELRAYVACIGVKWIEIEDERGGGVLVKVSINNKGQTPARRFSVRHRSYLKRHEGDLVKCYDSIDRNGFSGPIDLAPAQEHNLIFHFDKGERNGMIDISKRNIDHVLHVTYIRYTDVFGRNRRTIATHILNPDSLIELDQARLSIYTRGNRST